MSAGRFYIRGHRNRKIEISLERAIELELAGVEVLIERGPLTETERAWVRDGVGLN